MTKPNITQGDWYAVQTTPATFEIGTDDDDITAAIARVSSNLTFTAYRAITVEQAGNNAILMAAAPKLLEALKIALDILECKNGYSKEHDNPRSILEMHVAVDAAQGKQ